MNILLALLCLAALLGTLTLIATMLEQHLPALQRALRGLPKSGYQGGGMPALLPVLRA